MKKNISSLFGRTVVLGMLSLVGVFLLTVGLWAQPKAPPARRPMPHRPVQPKVVPHRGVPAKPHPFKRIPHARRRYYWRPYYKNLPPRIKVVWKTMGYPYYVGGTDYVIVTQESTTTSEMVPAQVDPPIETAAPTENEPNTLDVCYQQIQEITEMVHDWRTMNESPEVHQRLERLSDSEELKELAKQIRAENERFDQSSREAMKLLIKSEDADEPMATMRTSMEKLIALFESLPEPPAEVMPADAPPPNTEPSGK